MRRFLFLCLILSVGCVAMAQPKERRQVIFVDHSDDSTKFYVDELDYATIDSTTTTTPKYKYVNLKRKTGADVRIYFSNIKNVVFRKVKEDVVLPDKAPKVGDYYYSDGTWSDGGLVSINDDGTKPVWAEVKPAPVQGKTVIGIVAVTDTLRMAQSDRDAGFKHGYVVCSKFVHDPNNKHPNSGEPFVTTKFSFDDNFECDIKVRKTGKSWYEDIEGREHCRKVIAYYGNALVTQCPTVYYTNIMAHPSTSSEWFIPSTGQMWDVLANLCGNTAAQRMKGWRTVTEDATMNCTAYIYDDPMLHFNSTLEKVAEADKELLEIDSDFHNYCPLWTSTRYSEDAMDIFNVGTKHKSGNYKGKSLIECMAEWYNGDCYARPILAF